MRASWVCGKVRRMALRIGLGLSDFSKVREQGYAYVDKTLLLRDLIDDGAEAILVPPPVSANIRGPRCAAFARPTGILLNWLS